MKQRRMNFHGTVLAVAFASVAAVRAADAEIGSARSVGGNDLFVNRIVPRLRIEIPPDGMEVLRNYRQVWRQKRPERIDVRATVRDGAAVYTNVAVHLKGSFTFQPIDAQPSLTLNFDKFANGQRFHGLSKIHLNNSVQDDSRLCEALARDLFNDAGVPTPRAGHAQVTLNGRSLGFYVLVEGANKPFLKRHFASSKGNLYDAGAGGDITANLEVDSGDEPDNHTVLSNLVSAAQEPDPAKRFARLSELLDVEQFLNFIALEVLLVHWDGYATGAPNNYRLFHDTSRGKMVFMPHGLDQILIPHPVSATLTPHFKGIIARALITTPEGRQLYLQRLARFATNEFSAQSLNARVDSLATRLRRELKADRSSVEELNEAVGQLKERIQWRTELVAQRLREPIRPIAFGAENSVTPTSWRFRTTNVRPASGKRTREKNNEVLQVAARNADMAGSWRTQVLLEQGRYELVGKARTEDFSPADVRGTNGVILRISGERSPKGTASDGWTELRYEFDVRGIEDVELVCEFRGRGTGIFDPASMRLLRKSPAANTMGK